MTDIIGLGHGVEVLGANQDVKTLNKGVVQDEDDGSKPPSPILAPEKNLAEIANISDFGVPQAELPKDQTSVENASSNEDGQDQSGDEAEDTVRPGETHNGEADVLGEEQGSRLLPGAGSVLDVVARLGGDLLVEDRIARVLRVRGLVPDKLGELSNTGPDGDTTAAKEGRPCGRGSGGVVGVALCVRGIEGDFDLFVRRHGETGYR